MLKRLLIGKPLKTEAIHDERISKTKALAILSSDAISSVAYATQGIVSVLPLLAFDWVLPITGLIVLLAGTLVASYRQVIRAYPGGGGAYTVAKENFTIHVALLAAAALFTDYVLTVAVSVSAGAAAVTSAVPAALPYTVPIDLALIALIMVVNLRGVRESASAFMLPTYLFIGMMYLMGVLGIFHPGIPWAARGTVPVAGGLAGMLLPALPALLLMKAFSSGATALTGVEAISNSVPSFREPAQKNAARTMLVMGTVLSTLFAITSYLAFRFHTLPSNTETTLSQIGHVVFGGGPLYYLLQITTTLILVLAANTAYTGFPMLASLLAEDGYLPRLLKARGDRLSFSNGIIFLSATASVLIVVFGGDTNALLPLYAIGVFISFTIAQTGMARKWLAQRAIPPAIINGFGAILTSVVFVVMAVSKFTSGAWIVLILIPAMIVWFLRVHGHYESMRLALRIPDEELTAAAVEPYQTLVIVPIAGINRVAMRSLAYARGISPQPVVLYVAFSDEEEARIIERWNRLGIPESEVRFAVLRSRYRSVLRPLTRFIKTEARWHEDRVTVVIPEFVTPRWWHKFLHNKTALLLQYGLRDRNVVVTSVPYHLNNVK